MRPAIAIVLALSLPTVARADATLDTIRADSARAQLVAFERTTKRIEGSGKGSGTIIEVDRFDPAAPQGQQWAMVSVNGKAPTAQQIGAYKKRNAGLPVPGFHRVQVMLKGNAEMRTDAAGRTVYLFRKLPANSVPTPGPDISTHLSAEATVEQVAGRPVLSQVRVFAAQPFAMMATVKMHVFETVSVYSPGPGGRPFLTGQSTSVDVSAPFGMGARHKALASFRPL